MGSFSGLTTMHLAVCLWVSLTMAALLAPVTSMAALPNQNAMTPPPLPTGETTPQTITIGPNHPVQEGFPHNTRRRSGLLISSLDLRHPLLSSCWNDYMSSNLAYLSKGGLSTSIYYTTQRVGVSLALNTSVPLIIRCDGRSYIPAESRLAFETTTIHPPSKTTSVGGFLWTPDPKCFSLKIDDCMDAYRAYSSATALAISSLYSRYWPSVPTLAANRSTTTTVVVPGCCGLPRKTEFLGTTVVVPEFRGLPPKIDFVGGLLSGATGISVLKNGICAFGAPALTCPARKDIKKCQLAVPEMTVYYWPTSSAGNYCDKTRVPATMTKPGEPNSAFIINRENGEGFKTMVTSPSALVYVPKILRQHPTVTNFGAGPSSIWEYCGSQFETAATFQIHPDDLSSMNPHYVSTAAVWTTEKYYGNSIYSTLYKYGLTTERVDLAAVFNPEWLKEYPHDNTADCGQIFNGAINTNVISTTITQTQVASMKQTNCSMRVLDPFMSPALAIPEEQLLKALDQEWLNWGGEPDEKGEPFCKPETSSILFHIRYISLAEATVTGTGLPWNTKPPAVVVTLTTVPP